MLVISFVIRENLGELSPFSSSQFPHLLCGAGVTARGLFIHVKHLQLGTDITNNGLCLETSAMTPVQCGYSGYCGIRDCEEE